MKTPEFEEGEFVRYVVEGPILALLRAEDGVGVALGTHPGECMVISGRLLKFIQRGPDPRDAEIERLRARVAGLRAWASNPDALEDRLREIYTTPEQQDGGELCE